jgi:hypothetical protein
MDRELAPNIQTLFWLRPDEADDNGLLVWALGRDPLTDEPFQVTEIYGTERELRLSIVDRKTGRNEGGVNCELPELFPDRPHFKPETANSEIAFRLLPHLQEILRSEPRLVSQYVQNFRLLREVQLLRDRGHLHG